MPRQVKPVAVNGPKTIYIEIPVEQVLILDAARVLSDGRTSWARWVKKYITPNRDWAKRVFEQQKRKE